MASHKLGNLSLSYLFIPNCNQTSKRVSINYVFENNGLFFLISKTLENRLLALSSFVQLEMLLYYFPSKNSCRSPKPCLHKPSELERKGFLQRMYLFILPVKQKKVNRPAPPVTEPTWRQKPQTKTDKERAMNRARGAALRSLRSPLGVGSGERSSSYSACRTVSAPLAF